MESKTNKKSKSKKNNKRNASFNLVELVVIIIITAIVTSVATGLIVYRNYDKINDGQIISGKSKEIEEFITAYNRILNSYVEDVDKNELINSAIEGMYNSLGDAYTTYMDKSISSDLKEQLNGEYEGLGIEITKNEDGTILITTIFKNSPAEQAGLKVGDIILKINDESVENITLSEAANKIKTTKSSTIIYKRDNKELKSTISIDKIQIPSVSTENFDGVGYIYISSFSINTYDQFKEELEKLEKQNIKSLVIDLRGNTGGYLKIANKISELFIEKGKKIYGLKHKDGSTDFYKDTTAASRNYKISVLINSSTASASEILAAALKESYGAIVVGTTSYGKGSVQETEDLNNGAMVKYTIAYWLTPSGDCINKKGITPDKEITLNKYDEYTYKNDNQLQEAIKMVK